MKDMAYQALDVLDAELLQRFRNSFLVRDPASTLRSLARHWPDFTDEEAGHIAIAAAVHTWLRAAAGGGATASKQARSLWTQTGRREALRG